MNSRLVKDIRSAPISALRRIALIDFERALPLVRPSVDPATISRYEDYNAQYGRSGV